MKRMIVLFLCALTLAFFFSGCQKIANAIETSTFTGVIESVGDNFILVANVDAASFDRAAVDFAKSMPEPGFDFAVGQTVRVTFRGPVRTTDPVQVTAVKIELVSQPAQENITFEAVIEQVYDFALLVSTTDDNVGFDMANIGYADDMPELAFEPAVGQKVRVTILPVVAESYPVQATAVSIELLAQIAVTDPVHPDYSAVFFRADSYAQDAETFIMDQARNRPTIEISSKQHLPALVFDDAAALSKFMQDGSAYFQFSVSYNSDGSMADAVENRYTEEYFQNSRLMVVYARETSGSNRHEIKDVAISGDTLKVAVSRIVAQFGTEDMADWFILLELPKDATSACSQWDAYIE